MRPWRTRAADVRSAALLVLGVAACSAAVASRAPRDGTPAPAAASVRVPGPRDASRRVVRIALGETRPRVRVSAAHGWRIYAADGVTVVALTNPGEQWILERAGRAITARREDSHPVTAREEVLIARPDDDRGTVEVEGVPYRGELVVRTHGDGLLVVNRVGMDDYLRGVVPREIGTEAPADAAAVEAQAVTARSYAVTHLADSARPYDMVATVGDQVYGGARAETAVGDAAVARTTGLVLLYGGQVVNAPYHSTCGGSTAEPQDVWRSGPVPYLQRVSDRVPGTDRYYCDWAAKYRWSRTYSGGEVRQNLLRYLRTMAGGRRPSIGVVRDVRVVEVTPAGRVATLAVDTDGRTIVLRGNEMRQALRTASGEMLWSTYFSVDAVRGREGLERLALRGGGNGHGVGMCQTGAIGRARAGQDVRTILQTYYPGTTVGYIE